MILKKIIISLIVILLVSFFTVKIDSLNNLFYISDYCKIRNDAVDLITISTLLMGFAFTVLGLLYTFDASKFLKKMKTTDYVIKRANSIMYCLWILGFSSMSSVILMVLNVYNIYMYFYFFSVYSLIFGIVLFILCTKNMYRLIVDVHDYDRKYIKEKYGLYKKHRLQNKENQCLENVDGEKDDETW